MSAESIRKPYIAPWSRIAILLFSLAIGCGLSYLLTGSLVPIRPQEALIFQSTLLFVVLGSAVLEHKFTRPGDSAVNALMGMVTLVTVYGAAPIRSWWLVFTYCLIVFLLAITCSVVSTEPELRGWRHTIARFTYHPAVFLGRARLLYSVVFLFGVFTFFGVQTTQTVILICFWGFFLALWPLGIPELLSGLQLSRTSLTPIGRIARVDSPGLVRVDLQPEARWDQTSLYVYQDTNDDQRVVIPLYKQSCGGQALGTGLCVNDDKDKIPGLTPRYVYALAKAGSFSGSEISKRLGGDPSSTLLGFVIEESNIAAIRFETWQPDLCREGMLVWCRIGNRKVFYQITDGVTREESLQTDRHGFQYAIAAQLGTLDNDVGFAKYTWLPPMNTPVFCEATDFGADVGTVHEGDFVFGRVPGTQIRIGGPFSEFMDYHTAILGVTGSGKTELAFDLIRYSLNSGIKVVCIDLTARYQNRLKDLNSLNLSISSKLSDELSQKLFEAETGPYGAGKEKQALKQFAEQLREDVSKRLSDFLTDPDQRLGIITLDEISNTKATLFITELYLTCLLHFARDNSDKCPRVLIVVEEAHTVMPEATTMGLGDQESRGLVSKISQIALQGRKYSVGLLVVAQRTATVSKTVLTQCNTMITLNCFDETSLGFLSNVYGQAHTRMISNLPKLHAVVFGKGVRSERPIVVEIPFDPTKVGA
jgi:hypothetical protein